MKRGAKWLVGMLGVIAVVVLATALFLATFDWNRARPWLTRTLTDTLGRSVEVEGDLDVSWHRDADLDGWRAWIPSPHVTADQVTVGNSAWAAARVFGTARRVEFDLALLPLLTHRIEIQMLRLSDPDANLERSADGRENWTFTDKPSEWTCDIGRIAVDHARFTFFDHGAAINIAGRIDALGESVEFDQQVGEQVRAARREVLERIDVKSSRRFAQLADKRAQARRHRVRNPQRYAFAWSAKGSVQKAAFEGNGKLGGMFYLRNPDKPFPLLGDMRVGDTHIVLVGTLTDPADLDALDLRLWLAGPNLSHLYDFAGLPLPNSPPYAMEGHLNGQFSAGTRLRYEDFTARIGRSDLSGTLAYESRKPRPLLTGKVESDELQFRDLAPLIGADSGEKVGADGKLLPETPFRPQRWRAMDAQVEFSGDRVFRDSELPIHRVNARIVMDDAQLSLQPFRFRYADGDVDATLRLDGRQAPIKGALDLDARGMQLERLLPAGTGGGDGITLGRADGKAQLHASGNSVGSLLGAANGELKVLLDQGTISKALLETAGLNMPNILLTRLFGDKQVKIDCAGADLVAKDGVFDARTFIVDTDVAVITVEGKLDLGREWIDMTVHPDAKGMRLLSLRSPLHVRGPFKDIDVSVDKKTLLARAAGAIGLAAIAAPAALLPLTSTSAGDAGNRCAGLLEHKPDKAAADKAPAAAPKKAAPAPAKKAG
jgi:uncharacterized protein involved in outer membrane biogenesis